MAWIGVIPDDNAVTLREPPLECDIVEPARGNVAEFEWIRGTRFVHQPAIANAIAGRWGLLAPRPLGFNPFRKGADADWRNPNMRNPD